MKDSDRSEIHLRAPRSVVLFSDWMKDKLEFDDIAVPFDAATAHEDDEEDDEILPGHQAMFGAIKKTLQKKNSPWKDLRLRELMESAPGPFDETIVKRQNWRKISQSAPR